MKRRDFSAASICISDDCSTPVNPEEVLSDVDLPVETCAGGRRQVIRIRDVPPDVQIMDLTRGASGFGYMTGRVGCQAYNEYSR